MLNICVLIGRLTKDPDLRYTPNGVAVANFTLAVDRVFSKEKETDFIPCVVWRKQAENCAEYIGKGSLVAVEGRIQVRSYDDKNGQRRWITEIICDSVQFLDRRGQQEQEQQQEQEAPIGEEVEFSEDDIPFNDTSNHTGITDLDRYTGGLHKGEVTIIAARPSIGKTALAVQIALQVAKKEKVVQVFSREMSQVQLGTRLIANQGKVDGQRMRTGHIRDEDWIEIVKAEAALSNLPLYINDEASTMPDIRAVCAEKKHKGLDLVIIDYMQLIEPHKRSDTREREVAEISRAIKKLTLEFEIPIIALSQLNRSTANKRPTLDTLRESGAIEQDADNVILLHKPDEKDVPDEDLQLYRTLKSAGRDYVEVIIGKQRNGPTGMFTMSYNPRHMEFIGIRRDEG